MVALLKSLVFSVAVILPILVESPVVAAQATGSDANTAVARSSIPADADAPADINDLGKLVPVVVTVDANDVSDANAVEAKPVVSADDDASRYLNAVREFADNVLKYGRDTYGPKHTPLFVDGLNIHTHEPVKWIAPNGDRWILSNLASQQNLFRTLDGLTRITGDPKYKQAAMDAIKYAFENLRSPNGLLYWGGHAAYDAEADKPCGRDIHELKGGYPYYELMWEVDPQATKQFIEAFWSRHILDWSNLDMDRHCYNINMTKPLDKPWDYDYKGGPAFFETKYKESGASFLCTGSDLFYGAALLTKLSSNNKPLVWAKRIAYRYVETRDPNTGIAAYILYTGKLNKMPTLNELGDDSFQQLSYANTFPWCPVIGDPKVMRCAYGYVSTSDGVPFNNFLSPWICALLVGDMMDSNGKEFMQWSVEELTAIGKVAYRAIDNSWIPMLRNGTPIEGLVFKQGCSFGPEGTVIQPIPAIPMDFWAYALAYRLTGNEFMWQMARDIALGIGFGDIGTSSGDSLDLKYDIDSFDPYALMAFLDLYKKTNCKAFLESARQIGDNIVKYRFHKGFFVPNSKYVYTRFDSLESFALLHFYATYSHSFAEVSTMWPNLTFFECGYRDKDPDTDTHLIYTLMDSSEPPISLQEAAASGDIGMVKSLIEKGVEVDSREDGFFKTALHRAVINGHIDIAKLLLDHDVYINARDGGAVTALHYASSSGNKEIIGLLIGKGADINAKNSFGDTPLQYAAYADNKDIIGLLLQKGATIANLHIASYMGDLEKAEAFINTGVDINAIDGHGYAPLHYAVQNNQKQVIELLIAKGAEVSVGRWGGKNGQTPLDIAVSRGHKDIAELLLSKGAEGSIHIAASIGDVEKVKAFLEDGTDVNVKDTRNMNALHYAAREGHKEVVELLLENGADVNAGAWYKRTAAEFAMRQNHTEIVELLISKGADISPLHLAIYMKDENKARSLIEGGADVNKQTPFGITPLNMAVFAGFKDLVELLIDKGANVNAKDYWGWTSLHSMVVHNSKDMVELLIANGADVNAKDVDGRIPLWYAEEGGHTEIAEILRKHGAKEEEGKAPESAPAPKEDKTADPNTVEVLQGTDPT